MTQKQPNQTTMLGHDATAKPGVSDVLTDWDLEELSKIETLEELLTSKDESLRKLGQLVRKWVGDGFEVGDKVRIIKAGKAPPDTPSHLQPSSQTNRRRVLHCTGVVFRARKDNKLVEVGGNSWIYTFLGDEVELVDRPPTEELLTHPYEPIRREVLRRLNGTD